MEIRDLAERGWFQHVLDAREAADRKIMELRSACEEEFVELNAALPGLDRPADSGQIGYTQDGSETQVAVPELRSHLVFNQHLPGDHPLSVYSPEFYGDPYRHIPAPMRRFERIATELHRLLDLKTIEVFEGIERYFALPFGSLASKAAMGERLLRIQWYPAIERGRLTSRSVRLSGLQHPIELAVIALDEAQEQEVVTRVGPHTDIGHWTWQVHATDSELRFADPVTGNVAPAPAGDWMYGNVCEFLAGDCGIPAPAHWVNLSEDSRRQSRVSISYFAHTRPGVASRGSLDGEKLYDGLQGLRYVSVADCDKVKQKLTSAGLADGVLIPKVLEWELSHSGPPPGFAVGLARYYDLRDGNVTARRLPKPVGEAGEP